MQVILDRGPPQPGAQCGVQRPLGPSRTLASGQVEDGPHQGRDRQAATGGAVVGREVQGWWTRANAVPRLAPVLRRLTSSSARSKPGSPHAAAADRWESTAPAPESSTADMARCRSFAGIPTSLSTRGVTAVQSGERSRAIIACRRTPRSRSCSRPTTPCCCSARSRINRSSVCTGSIRVFSRAASGGLRRSTRVLGRRSSGTRRRDPRTSPPTAASLGARPRPGRRWGDSGTGRPPPGRGGRPR